MKPQNHNQQIKAFVMGGVAVLILLLFLGATNAPPPPNYGRFQVSSWATPINGGALIGAFVIDSATGETKTAYSRLYRSAQESKVLVNNLKKPFINMK